MSNGKIRLAVAGGRRGGNFRLALEHLAEHLELVAICDPLESMIQQWQVQYPGIATFSDYDQLLDSGIANAVLLATPMQLHAAQAVAAMKAGLDVLSEVPACVTHDQACNLVRTVQQTGRTYMMAENYCYRRPHMMIRHMVEQGAFGELTYAEGMYLHDCRGLKFNEDGSLTWRGDLNAQMLPSQYYPTHSLGPIAQWLGINRSDYIESVYNVGYPALSLSDYVQRRFGTGHPGARPGYWQRGDGANCLIRTQLGRVIHLRIDTCSSRPHHMVSHELQGTRGCYRTTADVAQDPLVWIDGISPGANPPRNAEPDWRNGQPMQWQSLYELADRFEHPRWRQWGEKAKKAGHGGGDFFVLEDFVRTVTGQAPNPIGVIDAVTWSSIIWLSEQSIRTGQAVPAIRYQ